MLQWSSLTYPRLVKLRSMYSFFADVKIIVKNFCTNVVFDSFPNCSVEIQLKDALCLTNSPQIDIHAIKYSLWYLKVVSDMIYVCCFTFKGFVNIMRGYFLPISMWVVGTPTCATSTSSIRGGHHVDHLVQKLHWSH